MSGAKPPFEAGRPATAMPVTKKAIGLQAANMLQKGMLDMMATKIILSLKAFDQLKVYAEGRDGVFYLSGDQDFEDVHAAAETLNKIRATLSMTRDECQAVRSQPEFVYPDERIRAIITEATDKVTALLLGDEV